MQTMTTERTPKRVLTSADYDELLSLVSAATRAARDAETNGWDRYRTDDECARRRKADQDAYMAVCRWAAQRTDHDR